jgi:hypothetical protein
MFSHPCPRSCGGLVLLGLLALAVGCGPSYKARAVVKGKVTFAGTPLTVGTVSFYGKDNLSGSATIDKNGNYAMNDAPLGDVKVTVFVPKLPPGGMRSMKGSPALHGGKDVGSVDPEGSGKKISMLGDMPDKVVPIPDRFGNVESSGLTYTVKKGEQTFDIPLKP